MSEQTQDLSPETFIAGAALELDTSFEPFPEIDPGVKAVGHRVLVQYRSSKKMSAGGIIIPGTSQEIDALQTTVVKVVSMGNGCYKARASGETWASGAWCDTGDMVLIPKFAGQRFRVGEAWFTMLNDDNILGRVTDVDAITAFTPNLSFAD